VVDSERVTSAVAVETGETVGDCAVRVAPLVVVAGLGWSVGAVDKAVARVVVREGVVVVVWPGAGGTVDDSSRACWPVVIEGSPVVVASRDGDAVSVDGFCLWGAVAD
jgi:hypothetical protein